MARPANKHATTKSKPKYHFRALKKIKLPSGKFVYFYEDRDSEIRRPPGQHVPSSGVINLVDNDPEAFREFVFGSMTSGPTRASAGVIAPIANPTQTVQYRRLELLEIEHKQRMEYARIEHERRMEVIGAEAELVGAKCRRLAEEIAPSNDRLVAMAGTFSAPPGVFDDEEMPC